jgi:putative Holliday junction resolvase
MARVLGIDYGTKRCGAAVTDNLQIAVHPLAAVSRVELPAFLEDYVIQEEVERVVFGIPTHADGNLMNLGVEIKKFAKDFASQHKEIVVDFQEESFTSHEASQILTVTTKKKKRKDKSKLDVLSAVLILQRYLQHI